MVVHMLFYTFKLNTDKNLNNCTRHCIHLLFVAMFKHNRQLNILKLHSYSNNYKF